MSKVLLIEDEPSLAAALQRVLEVEGYEVVTTTDASAAWTRPGGDFQVIVTDLKMPASAAWRSSKACTRAAPTARDSDDRFSYHRGGD